MAQGSLLEMLDGLDAGPPTAKEVGLGSGGHTATPAPSSAEAPGGLEVVVPASSSSSNQKSDASPLNNLSPLNPVQLNELLGSF